MNQALLEEFVRRLEQLARDQEHKVAYHTHVPDSVTYYPVPQIFSSNLPGVVISGASALLHENTIGLFYTTNIDTASPVWVEMNTGLTLSQYQNCNWGVRCPNGSLYVGRRGFTDPFLAWAPGLGEPWTIIEDAASLASQGGILSSFNCNLTKAEEIVYITGDVNTYADVHIGSRNSFIAGLHYGVASYPSSVSFGNNEWLIMAEGGGSTVFRQVLSADAQSLLRSSTEFSYLDNEHLRAGTSGTTYHWQDGDLWVGSNNLDSKVKVNAGLLLDIKDIDETGVQLMGSSTNRKKSGDSGVSFSDMTALPAAVTYDFSWIEGVGSSSRWAAAGSNNIYVSGDFGVTWENRTGNLTSFIATPQPSWILGISGFSKQCVDGPDLIQGLQISVSPTNPLGVHITGALIPMMSGWVNVQTTSPDIDLTSHVPATGVRIVAFQVDSAGAWSVVDGTIFAITTTPTVANLPTPTAGSLIIFFAILYPGIDGVCTVDFVIPAPVPTDYAGISAALTAKVSDAAYSALAWDGDTTHAPSKNAVRDKIEAILAGTLAQFGATTSAQLASVISDETGSGALVFANSPVLVTPNLGTPSALVLTNATGLPIGGITGLGAGIATFLATPSSANLASALTDETGSGKVVFDTSPTLVTPVLGVATATSINKVTITAPATSATLTIDDGKTVTFKKTMTFTGTDGTNMTFPAASDTIAGLGTVQTFSVGQRFDGNIGVSVDPDATMGIFVNRTTTVTSGSQYGINAGVFANPSGASSATITGTQVTARSTNGNGQNFTGQFAGGIFNVIHQGTATMSTAKGATYQVLVNNTGTITDAIALDVLAHSVSGGGAITNAYGLRIGNITAGGTLNYAISTGTGLIHFGDTVDIVSGKNLGIGSTTFGTSATNTIALFNGTVPSTSPADTVQLFSVDLSAGNATLGIRTETAVVTETVTSDRTLSVKINGTTYKILLKV